MSVRTTPWPPGTPSWADLATSDLAASTAFYRAVLGWGIDDLGPDFGGYGIATVRGHGVAGIGPMADADRSGVWTTYLATEDVDRTAQAVTAHGGAVVVPATDVGDQGRMAVAVDPTGAAFGLWQAGRLIGSQLVDEPGAVCRNDHVSADPAAARDFYGAVFGHTFTRVAGELDYATIDGPAGGTGRTIGGIGGIDACAPAATPARWNVTFAVADVDAACAAAIALGGTVVTRPVDTDLGRIATLTGPEGATFALGTGVRVGA